MSKKLTIREVTADDQHIVCGVAHQNELDSWTLDVWIGESIDIGYEEALLTMREELELEGLSEEEIEERLDCPDIEMCDGTTYLIGDWYINDEGKYDIDPKLPNDGYAGTYDTSSGYVTIELSKWVARCNKTSPCFMMKSGGPCGDLGTVGSENMLAYSLPEDCYYHEED